MDITALLPMENSLVYAVVVMVATALAIAALFAPKTKTLIDDKVVKFFTTGFLGKIVNPIVQKYSLTRKKKDTLTKDKE